MVFLGIFIHILEDIQYLIRHQGWSDQLTNRSHQLFPLVEVKWKVAALFCSMWNMPFFPWLLSINIQRCFPASCRCGTIRSFLMLSYVFCICLLFKFLTCSCSWSMAVYSWQWDWELCILICLIYQRFYYVVGCSPAS